MAPEVTVRSSLAPDPPDALTWSAVAPLGALVTGVVVMRLHDPEGSRWLTQLSFPVLGLLVFGLARLMGVRFWMRYARLSSLAALFALMLTFKAAGEGDVHRWLPCGPLHLHVSSLASPCVLLALALRSDGQRDLLMALIALLLVAVQPDAGEATALGVAIVASSWLGSIWLTRILALVTAVAVMALAWLRPDPLPRVEDVEGITQLAWRQSAVLGVTSIVSLALLPLPFFVAWWRGRRVHVVAERLAASLGAYVVVSLLVTATGAFPVPVMGYGASPILGLYLALGFISAASLADVALFRDRALNLTV